MKSATILNDMRNAGPAIFYNAKFRQVIEENLTWLLNRQGTTTAMIDNHVAYRADGDFTQILDHLQVKPEFHWLTMRLNGYTSPMDYRQDKLIIILPDIDDIMLLVNTFRANQSI